MTTEEKRIKLVVHCASTSSCRKCPLHNSGIKCGEGTSFMKKKGDKYDMPDNAIETAYAILFEGAKPQTQTVHGCPFASGLICSDAESKCASCGWNPDVEAKRKARLKFLFETPAKNGLRYLRIKKHEKVVNT